jgi:hypothetical protein
MPQKRRVNVVGSKEIEVDGEVIDRGTRLAKEEAAGSRKQQRDTGTVRT